MPNIASRLRGAIACLGLMALAATPSEGQGTRATLRGVVTDSAGTVLRDAEVRIDALARSVRTDTAGAFSFGDLAPTVHLLTVRRLGYQIQMLNVSLTGVGGDPIRIVLISEPVTLAGMNVEARDNPMFEGFEERRARAIGSFITKEQIEARNSSSSTDVFRNMPGIRIVQLSRGPVVRFVAGAGVRRGARGSECTPTIWVDGQAAPGLEMDDIRAGDLYGIEIYRTQATTPVQFVANGVVQCGTIVVWTRRKR
ncbi:MAG TPA: carboxypeptidase-like regulatory domain-containing protein [Gemmatimonadaceae bacterium]|nr:carboxypeptidase-like regulatory domain-containing protein [Gemmatimonadaceae bacterium]